MFQLIIKLIAVVLILIGVTLVYDARPITKRYFGFGDQNEGADGLKMWGYLIAVIGGLILYFNI